MTERTVVIVTHRETVMRECDRVVRDERLRDALKIEREKQLKKFSYEVVSERMKKCLGKIIGG